LVKCSYCGVEAKTPVVCPYCGKIFCKEHGHLQKHNCISLQKNSKIIKDNYAAKLSKKPNSKNYHNGKKELLTKKTVCILSIIWICTILAVWITANIKGYNIGYDVGFNNGYLNGITNASIIGYSIGFTKGNLSKYQPSYEIGYESGFAIGNSTGYSIGIDVGNQTGYIDGKNHGQMEGYREAYQKYYSIGECEGNQTGYYQGYLKGREDIKKHSFNLTNPTYSEMIQFLSEDRTDRIRYDPDNFVCHDYAATVKRNAFNKGYYCYYVIINPEPKSSIPIFPIFNHAIVAFNTTDRGLIFIEPQHDDIVKLIVGKSYSKLNGYKSPIYDDTILEYTLIW